MIVILLTLPLFTLLLKICISNYQLEKLEQISQLALVQADKITDHENKVLIDDITYHYNNIEEDKQEEIIDLLNHYLVNNGFKKNNLTEIAFSDHWYFLDDYNAYCFTAIHLQLTYQDALGTTTNINKSYTANVDKGLRLLPWLSKGN